MSLSSRLKVARHRRGLSKVELAKRSGISVRLLAEYERDDETPEPRTIAVLAKALEFPVEFFQGGELEEPSPGTASFRAMSRMTGRQRDAALAAGALAIEFSNWIDRRFELPTADLPNLERYEPEAAAQMVRHSWGLGEKPIRNVIHLLELRGVRLFSLAEQCREVDAFSLWRSGVPYIFLNAQKSAEHSRFDAAHELGHLVLHRHAHGGCDAARSLLDDDDEPATPPVVGRTVENEANRFASALLMPGASILADMPRAPRMEFLIEYKRLWRVSLAAMIHRIRGLGIINEWQYRNYCIEVSRRGYRTHEPHGIDERETSQVIAKVFAHLRQKNITRGRVARALGLPMQELEGLIFGLALAGVDGGAAGAPETGVPEPHQRGHLRLVE